MRCDDPLDTERFAGDAGGDDVGVVAGGHRGEGVGRLDTGPHENVTVESDPTLTPSNCRSGGWATPGRGR